jgi:cyclohexa-1,5-dienecarbonyl-CoA hydratase
MRGLVRAIGERRGAWVRLVLNEPPGNLLSLAMVRALDEALSSAAARRGLKWLTIEGEGGDFSYGAKIQEHLPGPMAEVLPATLAVFRRLLSLPSPTAALVTGRCLGGGFELATCCDDILATDDATFGLPGIRLAAFAPAAAAVLPLRVGASRASRAMLTGVTQTPAYWHDAGLLSLVAPQADLLEVAGEWFDQHLAPRSAIALAHAATASRLTLRAAAEPALAEAERLYVEGLLRTADAVEGIEAWLEERPPRWG